MLNRRREFAKFFSGFAAAETLGHWWLGTWGREMLPMKFSWFMFTEQWNYFSMAFWPVVLVALVYFAWVRPVQAARAAAAAGNV